MPDKVKIPDPFFVRVPSLIIFPEIVWLLDELNIIADLFVMLPEYDPLFNNPLTSIVPFEIIIDPTSVPVPLNVSLPVPFLLNAPDPVIVPEISWSLLFPAVKVCELAISIVPAPANDDIVSLASTS